MHHGSPDPILSRRGVLRGALAGLGSLGMSSLLAGTGLAAAEPHPAGRQRPHHPAKAKSLIWIFLGGGPSQFESFTWKPELAKRSGTKVRSGNVEGALMAPQFPFRQHGQSGLWISDLFPEMAKVVDDLCVIESMKGDQAGHSGAWKQSWTGFTGRPMPGLGSWIIHGLGSANPDLPPYINLHEGSFRNAFLPATTQGAGFSVKQKPPTESARREQRKVLDLVDDLDRAHAVGYGDDDVLDARLQAGELAYRMLESAPAVADVSKESSATLGLYSLNAPDIDEALPKLGRTLSSYGRRDYALNCLIARRLVERNVRVVTYAVGGGRGWDAHSHVKDSMAINAKVIDRPIAGLITDLKQRGLLDSTIVVIGGEFGRTPYNQDGDGRDHFPRAYTYVVAGGGFKRGMVYGQTDEIGMDIVQDRVHITDLHATLLWQLGLDHERLTHPYGGRDVRPTDTFSKVHRGMLA